MTLGLVRSLRWWLVCAMAVVPAVSVFAHPSRGIVASRDGRVFFSDLTRVWMIDTNGRLSLIRPASGGHTHELFLASDGSLYGEDSYYLNDRYTSALWRRSPSGRLTLVFGPAANPPPGIGVVRDTRGCTYQGDQTRRRALVLYRHCPGRAPQRLAGAVAPPRDVLSNIGGATLASSGFYFRHGSTVYRVEANGHAAVAARGLSDENFGIAVAADGSILAAEYRNRRVVRIAPDSRRTVVSTSRAPWAPTGLSVTPAAIYVLEAADPGRPQLVRVRKIANDRSRVLAVR